MAKDKSKARKNHPRFVPQADIANNPGGSADAAKNPGETPEEEAERVERMKAETDALKGTPSER